MTDSSDSKASLERHYELLRTRIENEYEQRDRDFLMYVTINAGLAAALGFLLQAIAPPSPGSWIASGAGIAILGLVGYFFGSALQGSVKSFSYWQCLMSAILAKLELAVLPSGFYGTWCHIVARHSESLEHFKHVADREEQQKLLAISPLPPISQDLIVYRLRLGNLLPGLWIAVSILGVLLIVGGVALVSCPRLQTFISVLWPAAPKE